MLGGVFAGARMGFVGDERFHGALIAVALVADFFILRAALRHHHNRWPLWLCVLGGGLAVIGHLTSEAIELTGFALLMAAALVNMVLMRRHRHEGGACCAHEAHEAHGAHP